MKLPWNESAPGRRSLCAGAIFYLQSMFLVLETRCGKHSNCPSTHDFDEVMRTADFEGFLVHHQLKFSSVLALNFRVHTQYAALSTPLNNYN